MSQKKVTPMEHYYRLEVLEEGQEERKFHDTQCLIKGKVEDHIIVSVPIEMSANSADILKEELVKEFGTDKIIIVTHNIQFLKFHRVNYLETQKSRLVN